MRRLSVVVAAVALFAAACGNDDDPAADSTTTTTTTSTTTTTTTTTAWQSCEAPRAGYAVEYPPDWHTNAGDVVERCHWFDVQPFQLEPATDAFHIDVHVRMVEGSHDAKGRRGAESGRVLLNETRTAAGRDAVVVEVASTGAGIGPAGSRSYTWFVQADGRTLIASTSETAAGDSARYDEVKAVVDRMMASLRFTERRPGCSSDGLSATPEPQPGLPEQVAATRRAIVDAATRCDYARLAKLASTGQRAFTASFGGAHDVASYWRQAEGTDQRPLRYLVGLLDAPHAERTVEEATQFVWPSAYAAERWADVPPAAREALRPLYDDEDFSTFERFGSYVGYRIGIARDGEWLFFVAGD
ncbi:MAG: hypothetical protein KY443_03285 [Actinobacteria bacterium]|nr:hypothetical protein [Actinomycetota bacterium]